MKFVDLFAGLGGFHLGFVRSGGFECVFASEIDPYLRTLYELNFGVSAEGDITGIDERQVPAHDVLCAGFPCQPFSLAGLKRGKQCQRAGGLIDDVIRIARHRSPEFMVLENVPGLLSIANGAIWNELRQSLEDLGYGLIHKIISPLDFGIPQNRKRLFLVASRNCNISGVFEWATPSKSPGLKEFLLSDHAPHKTVDSRKRAQLEKWQQLLTSCELPEHMPSLSISAQEFGATYPLDFSRLRIGDLRRFNGAYGQRLSACGSRNEILKKMPSYCRKHRQVPGWLKRSVEFSRSIYRRNRSFLDQWHVGLNKRHNSWQLLEWRGYSKERQLAGHLLQFRASGIRVLKTDCIPALIAMTTTQIPIIGSEMRYLSKYEAAKLQYLHGLSRIPDNDSVAFKAFGNAVNSKIAERIASNIKHINSNP